MASQAQLFNRFSPIKVFRFRIDVNAVKAAEGTPVRLNPGLRVLGTFAKSVMVLNGSMRIFTPMVDDEAVDPVSSGFSRIGTTSDTAWITDGIGFQADHLGYFDATSLVNNAFQIALSPSKMIGAGEEVLWEIFTNGPKTGLIEITLVAIEI